MDWTLTGAVVGVAVLASAVGYELFVITRSNPEPPKKYQATSVLIPARERPAVDASSNAPAAGYALQSIAPQLSSTAGYPQYPSPVEIPPPVGNRPKDHSPALQTNAPQVSNTAGSPQYTSRVEIPPLVASRPKDHSPPPDYASAAHNEVKPPQPQISFDSWEVQTTAKASYYNLGGHVDKNGVVDSTASSYLREALKKHKNYPKLPAQIQAYINAPNINLAKIAGYRALLGMDEKEMEEKQGVKFIRVASRGIEIASPGAADFDASPLDLSSLDRMDFDLRLRMIPGIVP